ncbi:MAG: hypothetical protein R3292_11680 [Alcanivorax sp.]|nr:hypothetical protein [Alcanivorax sp.]
MKIAALLPLALLAGCQHFSYLPPSGEQTASVTFTGNAAAQPMVCVPDQGFRATEYALGKTPMGSDSFNDLLATMKKSPEVTTQVAAGQTRIGVNFNQRQTDGSRDRCQVALEFNARQGASYKANFTHSAGQCGLSLTDDSGAPVDAVLVDWKCP